MWRKDFLLAVILCWTAVVAGGLVWLPIVRGATQGPAYQNGSWPLELVVAASAVTTGCLLSERSM